MVLVSEGITVSSGEHESMRDVIYIFNGADGSNVRIIGTGKLRFVVQSLQAIIDKLEPVKPFVDNAEHG